MENITQQFEGNDIKPSGTLKVLTILSMIGSALGLISALSTFFMAQKNYDKVVQMMNSPEVKNAPEFVKNLYNDHTLELAKSGLENKLPIMIIGVLASALCLYGAIAMRKLQKQGYILWLTGEILPLIGNLFFIGASLYTGITGIVTLVFPAIFIILYTVYRKELRY